VSRRGEVLDAAIHVTGARGIRGLTHGAVDGQGGLPAGTASNHFRSRSALVAGTIQRLGELIADEIAHFGATPVTTIDELADTLGRSLEMSLGAGRFLAVAAFALYSEAGVDPALREYIDATNGRWRAAMEQLLRSAGVTDRVELRAACLLSYGNGLIVDQLALRDPDFDPGTAMRLGVHGICS
jgi:DNA-binding transcriptional regulator YbjK